MECMDGFGVSSTLGKTSGFEARHMHELPFFLASKLKIALDTQTNNVWQGKQINKINSTTVDYTSKSTFVFHVFVHCFLLVRR